MHKLLTTLFTAALGLAGFGLALPAYATHDGMGEHCQMHSKKTFEEADTNKNGSLDKEEAKSACTRNFEKMDTNKDGAVSKEELNVCGRHMNNKSEAMHEKRSKEFTTADTDNDGTLTKEEAQKLPRVSKNFDVIDTDKDGTLDRDEVHHFMQEHKGR